MCSSRGPRTKGKSLASIDIPVGVTKIAASAFEACNALTEVILPSHVDTIGKMAFGSCKNLTSVTCENPTPAKVANKNSFYTTVYTKGTLYVPEEGLNAYKAIWKQFKNIATFGTTGIDGVTALQRR